jgi:hypothetical protein
MYSFPDVTKEAVQKADHIFAMDAHRYEHELYGSGECASITLGEPKPPRTVEVLDVRVGTDDELEQLRLMVRQQKGAAR